MQRIAIAELPVAQRGPLFDRLYEIFCEHYAGLDRAGFEAHYMRPGDHLALCHAADGQLAGFISHSIETFRVGARSYTVFGSLVFIRLGYQGGTQSMRFALLTGLRHKLRHPFARMVHVTVAATPAAYELNAKVMPRVYPSRERETPADVRALIDAVIERRSMTPLDGQPRLVERKLVPRQPNRVSSSTTLRDSADVRYYNAIAPNWAIGQCPVMCIPVQLDDLLGMAWKLVCRVMRRSRNNQSLGYHRVDGP